MLVLWLVGKDARRIFWSLAFILTGFFADAATLSELIQQGQGSMAPAFAPAAPLLHRAPAPATPSVAPLVAEVLPPLPGVGTVPPPAIEMPEVEASTTPIPHVTLPPAGTFTVPPTGENPQQFVANTFGLLSHSSSSIGDSATSLLDIQGTLDQMKINLASEYTFWENKRKQQLREHDALVGEVARLEKTLQEQKSLREEKLRLNAELQKERQLGSETQRANEEGRQKWELEREAYSKDLLALEGEVQGSRSHLTGNYGTISNQTREVQAMNHNLQHQIFILNGQVQQAEDAKAKQELDFKKMHPDLLAKIEVTQKEILELQAQVVAQSHLQMEVRSYRLHVAAQKDETNKLHQNYIDFQSNCSAVLKKRDADIYLEKQRFSEANQQIQRCQATDALNQQLQIKLNQCKAMVRTAR